MALSRQENWRTVEEFPSYEVSDRGRVKSNITGKILSPKTDRGYNRVVLYKDGRTSDVSVHRLVGDAFLENPHGKKEINHINGNKLDNSVENLEWVSRSENMKHAFASHLKEPSGGLPRKGLRVIETNECYESAYECARVMDLDQCHINQCLRGKRRSHKGYHFEYTEM